MWSFEESGGFLWISVITFRCANPRDLDSKGVKAMLNTIICPGCRTKDNPRRGLVKSGWGQQCCRSLEDYQRVLGVIKTQLSLGYNGESKVGKIVV